MRFIIGFGSGLCGASRTFTFRYPRFATGLLLGDNKAKLAQFSFPDVNASDIVKGLLDGIKLMKGEDIAEAFQRYHC